MRAVMASHDDLVARVIEGHRGRVFKHTGDGVAAVFASAIDAVTGSIELARALDGNDPSIPIKARVGLHTGEAEARGDDFFGAVVNRAARLMGVAHGGQVVVSQATADLARDALPAGVGVMDLGEHRLRDLSRPERVFQVTAEGLASGFPVLRSLDARPGNLPGQLTSFVGRARELERVCAAVLAGRIVTLTGVGGVGKTRLAVQVAAEVVPQFDDGAWLFELAAAPDGDTMVQLVAATLAVRPQPGVDLAGSVVESLRHRSLLAVLDNCEHLLEPAGRLAEAIVRNCPGVRVLATSREGLAVEGEQVWPLPSLPVSAPDGEHDSDAVRLFEDRALAARPGFVLDGANAAPVVELCRRLDGIPLAIELAAARVVAMSPAEIASHLDERFRLLTGGRRTAVERHQTLRATVDWSYSLLAPAEQRVFDRLGVFSGTFGAVAARSVVAGDGIEDWDVLDALAGLVAKSMLNAEESPAGETRYAMLETLRQYARERLDGSGDADRWRRRHAEHYALFAETAGPALMGPDELAWRPRLLADLDNLRAAYTWGLDSAAEEDIDLAMRVLAGLTYEGILNRSTGICAWAEKALPFAPIVAPALRTSIYASLAWYHNVRGEVERARDVARQGIDTGDTTVPVAAALWSAIGYAAVSERDAETVRAAMAQALVVPGPYADARMSQVQANSAMFEIGLGQLRAARQHAEDALTRARASSNPSALAMALYSAAWATEDVDPGGARAMYEESISLHRKGAPDAVFCASLQRVGPLRLRAGHGMEAVDGLVEAILVNRDTGDRVNIAFAVLSVATVLSALHLVDAVPDLLGILDTNVIAPVFPDEPLLLQLHSMAMEQVGEDAYTAAHARGAALDYDGAVLFILAVLERARAVIASEADPTSS
jgi:predicted ATPase